MARRRSRKQRLSASEAAAERANDSLRKAHEIVLTMGIENHRETSPTMRQMRADSARKILKTIRRERAHLDAMRPHCDDADGRRFRV